MFEPTASSTDLVTGSRRHSTGFGPPNGIGGARVAARPEHGQHRARAQASPPADVESATPEETARLVLDTLER